MMYPGGRISSTLVSSDRSSEVPFRDFLYMGIFISMASCALAGMNLILTCSLSAGAVDELSSLYVDASSRNSSYISSCSSSLFLLRFGSLFGGSIGFDYGGFLLVSCILFILVLRSSELLDDMLVLFLCQLPLLLSLTISTRRLEEGFALCGTTTVLSDSTSWMACSPAASSVRPVSP